MPNPNPTPKAPACEGERVCAIEWFEGMGAGAYFCSTCRQTTSSKPAEGVCLRPVLEGGWVRQIVERLRAFVSGSPEMARAGAYIRLDEIDAISARLTSLEAQLAERTRERDCRVHRETFDQAVIERDAYQARAFAAEARGAERTWQPISTAPHDGAQIILGQFIGTDEPYVIGGWYEPVDRCWYDFDSQRIDPTHWQPLPPPPLPAEEPQPGHGDPNADCAMRGDVNVPLTMPPRGSDG